MVVRLVDPELGVFGSAKKRRGTDAGQALIEENCCGIWIIAVSERNGTNYCGNCICKPACRVTRINVRFVPRADLRPQ